MTRTQKIKVSQADIEQSVRDLARIHNIPSSKVQSFISWFIRKYRLDCSYQDELRLRQIAREEIKKFENGDES